MVYMVKITSVECDVVCIVSPLTFDLLDIIGVTGGIPSDLYLF